MMNVVVIDSFEGAGVRVAQELAEQGHDVVRLVDGMGEEAAINLADRTSVVSALGHAQGQLGGMDAVVCALGSSDKADILACSFERWRDVQGRLADGAIAVSQEAVRAMSGEGRREEPARIVYALPAGALAGEAEDVAGAAAAFAIRGFCRHLAINVGALNILTNVVGVEDGAASHDEAARMVAMLLSPESGNVTGLTVNAGARPVAV